MAGGSILTAIAGGPDCRPRLSGPRVAQVAVLGYLGRECGKRLAAVCVSISMAKRTKLQGRQPLAASPPR
jgi:hypothetical protein